jgi:hypothetical protein
LCSKVYQLHGTVGRWRFWDYSSWSARQGHTIYLGNVGIYRAPNEDMWVLERLAAQTGYAGNSTMHSFIGGDLNYPMQMGMEMRFVIVGLNYL